MPFVFNSNNLTRLRMGIYHVNSIGMKVVKYRKTRIKIKNKENKVADRLVLNILRRGKTQGDINDRLFWLKLQDDVDSTIIN